MGKEKQTMLAFKLNDHVIFKKLDLIGRVVEIPEGKEIRYKVKCDTVNIDYINAYEQELEPFETERKP